MVKCPTECDEDCRKVCHEEHYTEMKRVHEPDECPGVRASLADLYT